MKMLCCVKCHYSTKDKYDLTRHFETQKHKNASNFNVTDVKYVCQTCKKFYSAERSLKRHQTYDCGNSALVVELKQENKVLKKENKVIKKEVKVTKKEVKVGKKEIKLLKEKIVIEKKAHKKTYKTAISLIKFLMEFRNDAPQLEGPVNICKKIEETKNIPVVLLDHYRNKKLVKYLGEFITGEYLKKDQREQSIWMSDLVRLTAIIKCDEWTRDKKGIKVMDIVISKITQKVKEIIMKFIQKRREENERKYINGDNPNEDYPDDIKIKYNVTDKEIYIMFVNALELIQKIDNADLNEDILKHVAPDFDIFKLDTNLV